MLASCWTSKRMANATSTHSAPEITLDTFRLFDQSRNREIPVAIYKRKLYTIHTPQQLVIFSHGYGQNRGDSYLAYSFLTKFLASKDFFVISIQHELPKDSLMPSTGIPQIVRRPFWDRGTDNIMFVINELKKSNPRLDFGHITLIGHSNGADIAALFPQKYPNVVFKIITLDNRRMALPKTTQPKVYSLRSSDQPADDGVLPTNEEQRTFKMTIVKLLSTPHNDMDDHANSKQREEINKYVLKFLSDRTITNHL